MPRKVLDGESEGIRIEPPSSRLIINQPSWMARTGGKTMVNTIHLCRAMPRDQVGIERHGGGGSHDGGLHLPKQNLCLRSTAR